MLTLLRFSMLFTASFAVLPAIHASAAVSFPVDNIPAPNFRLTYFDGRGAAEVTRLLMKIGGIDFTDHRFPIHTTASRYGADEEYTSSKKSGQFAVNMDRLPVLDIDKDLTIGQSRAIERYIAGKCMLFGGNDEERAMIDCISENVRDIKEKYAAIRRRETELKDETASETPTSQWFHSDSGLQEWLAKLERSLPQVPADSEFAVGNTLSLADISIWHLLRDHFHGHLHEVLHAEEKAQCIRLSRIAHKVSEHSAIKKWLTDRPLSPF